MLKKYNAREDEAKSKSEKKDLKVTTSAKVLLEEEIPNIDEKSLFELGPNVFCQ